MKLECKSGDGIQVKFEWPTLVDSDSDGEVSQPSFVLPAVVVTDKAGFPSATHPDCQPVGQQCKMCHQSVGAEVSTEWQRMFGTSFSVPALRDADTGTTDDSVDFVKVRGHLELVSELIEACGGFDSFIYPTDDDRIADDSIDHVREGVASVRVGQSRHFDRDVKCRGCDCRLFDPLSAEACQR